MAKIAINLFIVLALCKPTFALGVSLESLIEMGLASHPIVQSKAAYRSAASTNVTAAKLRFAPNPSFSTQRNQVAYEGQPLQRLPATNITITQPLLLDGVIIAGYSKSKAGLGVAELELLESGEDIARRIINSYSEWLRAYQKIIALEASVELHTHLVGAITRKYQQGTVAKVDSDLSFSRLSQIKADLDAQKSNEKTALNSLTELTGDAVTREHLVRDIAIPKTLPDRAEANLRARSQSYSVRRHEFQAKVALAEAKEVRAQALPQVSLQAQRQIGNSYFPGAPGFDLVGLVVSYGPGGGLSNSVSAIAALDRAKGAALMIEAARREVADRVNADYNEFEFSGMKKLNLEKSANLAGDIGASYSRQYNVGRKNWLEVMNSAREKLQAEIALADVNAALVASSWRLSLAILGVSPFGLAIDIEGVK
jgi:adhesin transport system outer membrane protein